MTSDQPRCKPRSVPERPQRLCRKGDASFFPRSLTDTDASIVETQRVASRSVPFSPRSEGIGAVPLLEELQERTRVSSQQLREFPADLRRRHAEGRAGDLQQFSQGSRHGATPVAPARSSMRAFRPAAVGTAGASCRSCPPIRRVFAPYVSYCLYQILPMRLSSGRWRGRMKGPVASPAHLYRQPRTALLPGGSPRFPAESGRFRARKCTKW
jgi:hypothetical protein